MASAVYYWFESRSVQSRDYAMCMCYFSAKHAVLNRTSKDWMDWNQDNVSE